MEKTVTLTFKDNRLIDGPFEMRVVDDFEDDLDEAMTNIPSDCKVVIEYKITVTEE